MLLYYYVQSKFSELNDVCVYMLQKQQCIRNRNLGLRLPSTRYNLFVVSYAFS